MHVAGLDIEPATSWFSQLSPGGRYHNAPVFVFQVGLPHDGGLLHGCDVLPAGGSRCDGVELTGTPPLKTEGNLTRHPRLENTRLQTTLGRRKGAYVGMQWSVDLGTHISYPAGFWQNMANINMGHFPKTLAQERRTFQDPSCKKRLQCPHPPPTVCVVQGHFSRGHLQFFFVSSLIILE